MAIFKLTDLPDIKRFYMPGVKAVCKCGQCNKDLTIDFEDQYMSYPKIGVIDEVFWCEDCDIEWKIKYDFSVTVELKQIGEQKKV